MSINWDNNSLYIYISYSSSLLVPLESPRRIFVLWLCFQIYQPFINLSISSCGKRSQFHGATLNCAWQLTHKGRSFCVLPANFWLKVRRVLADFWPSRAPRVWVYMDVEKPWFPLGHLSMLGWSQLMVKLVNDSEWWFLRVLSIGLTMDNDQVWRDNW